MVIPYGQPSLGLLVAMLAACSSGSSPAAPAPAAGGQWLEQAEAALLAAPSMRVRAHITASGAVAVDMDVEVLMRADNRLSFRFEGRFAGQPVSMRYVADGACTRDGVPVPGELNRAVIIGMTRMGLLHNVAILQGGGAPDHADGGVAEWVRAMDVTAGAQAGGRSVRFQIVVADQPSGTATLRLNDALVPTGRSQEVVFPNGTMMVEESYEITLGGEVDDREFATGTRC